MFIVCHSIRLIGEKGKQKLHPCCLMRHHRLLTNPSKVDLDTFGSLLFKYETQMTKRFHNRRVYLPSYSPSDPQLSKKSTQEQNTQESVRKRFIKAITWDIGIFVPLELQQEQFRYAYHIQPRLACYTLNRLLFGTLQVFREWEYL
jgi:hypothetical protein